MEVCSQLLEGCAEMQRMMDLSEPITLLGVRVSNAMLKSVLIMIAYIAIYGAELDITASRTNDTTSTLSG